MSVVTSIATIADRKNGTLNGMGGTPSGLAGRAAALLDRARARRAERLSNEARWDQAFAGLGISRFDRTGLLGR